MCGGMVLWCARVFVCVLFSLLSNVVFYISDCAYNLRKLKVV